MNLVCSSGGSSTVPLLYQSFSGQTLYQFSGDTSSTTKIGNINDPAITSVVLQIVAGTYGSSKTRYIERTVLTTSKSSSSQYSLSIIFVEASQISQSNYSPTFFPQIPSDMFYPIYLLS